MIGAEARGEGDRGRVGAAPAERRDLRVGCGVAAQPLEAGDDDDLALLDLGLDPPRFDVGDAGLAVAAVGRDAGLRAGQADGRQPERVEGHRDERRRLMLARGQQHVELA